jgi:hypothetical protein
MSACYGEALQKFQSAILLKTDRVYSLSVFDNCQGSNLIANFTSIPLGKKLGLELCLDAGYRIDTAEMEKFELGLLKTFKSKWLKGLLYLCYKYETKSVDTCILLNI